LTARNWDGSAGLVINGKGITTGWELGIEFLVSFFSLFFFPVFFLLDY
jgi:hypothetical protein